MHVLYFVLFFSYLSHTRWVILSVPFKMENLFHDIGGRYLIVQGTVINEKINKINVYGPDDDNPTFFKILF